MKLLKNVLEFVTDTLETITFVGSIFMIIILFIAFPTGVQGASMEPTFHTGDRIIVSKFAYKLKPIKRGDIIVLQSPKNPDVNYIKRVIGLSGDTITIKDGKVYVNNDLLNENYISVITNTWDFGAIKDNVPYVVPDNYVFVMGDNRPRSSDSREFGAIPVSSVVGEVVYRFYPLNKAELLH